MTTTAPRIPADDPALAARQAEMLRRLGPLSGSIDAELAAILRLATTVSGAARASVHLLDEEEMLVLSDEHRAPVHLPRTLSICARTSRLSGVFVCDDLAAHPEFATHPAATGPERVRFYASAPMRLPDGDVIGTLCVYDDRPRGLTADQAGRLADLATVALGLFERRWHIVRAVQAAALLEEAEARSARVRAFQRGVLDALGVGVLAADEHGRPFLANRTLGEWTGCLRPDGQVDLAILDRQVYAADGVTPLAREETPLARASRGEDVRDVEVVGGDPGGPRRVTLTSGATVRDDDGTRLGAVVTITDVTAQRELERRLREG